MAEKSILYTYVSLSRTKQVLRVSTGLSLLMCSLNYLKQNDEKELKGKRLPKWMRVKKNGNWNNVNKNFVCKVYETKSYLYITFFHKEKQYSYYLLDPITSKRLSKCSLSRYFSRKLGKVCQNLRRYKRRCVVFRSVTGPFGSRSERPLAT